MFPLAGHDSPGNAAQLSEALIRGLHTLFAPPTGREMVVLEAPGFPEAEHLTVDLTGCRLNEQASQPPRGLHGYRPALSAERFVLTATPLLVRDAAVRVELTASNVRFDYAHAEGNQLFLVPSPEQSQTGQGEGNVRVQLGLADLEALLLAVLQPIAEANGLGVEDTHIELQSEGHRAVRLHVWATGKKLFVKAKVHVYGRLQVDEKLNATVDQLRCEGDGVIGEMAEKMIQPRLTSFNGMTLPLAGFSLGGLALHDLNISTADGLEITARLGGASAA